MDLPGTNGPRAESPGGPGGEWCGCEFSGDERS